MSLRPWRRLRSCTPPFGVIREPSSVIPTMMMSTHLLQLTQHAFLTSPAPKPTPPTGKLPVTRKCNASIQRVYVTLSHAILIEMSSRDTGYSRSSFVNMEPYQSLKLNMFLRVTRKLKASILGKPSLLLVNHPLFEYSWQWPHLTGGMLSRWML